MVHALRWESKVSAFSRTAEEKGREKKKKEREERKREESEKGQELESKKEKARVEGQEKIGGKRDNLYLFMCC